MIHIFGEHLTILIQQTHDKESAFEREKKSSLILFISENKKPQRCDADQQI